jgi:hypothetical protein
MVVLSDSRADARLARQLERGLKEIHQEPRRGVEPRQCLRASDALQTMIADETTDNRAVLLLDPSLVVLSVRAGASKLDAATSAIVHHRFVYELAAVIAVEPEQLKRKTRPHAFNAIDDEPRLAHDERQTLRPSRCYVCQHERMDEASRDGLPAMRHQIDFHVAGGRVVPVCERPNGNTSPQGWFPTRPSLGARCCPGHVEQSVNCGRARREQSFAERVVEHQVPVALKRIDECWQERPETFAAKAVRRLPERRERLTHGLVVQARSARRTLLGGLRGARQHPDRVLAMITADGYELAQNTGFLARVVT